MVTRGGGCGWCEGRGLDEGSQRYYKLPVISTKDIMYNMIYIINTAICYIRKLLRE